LIDEEAANLRFEGREPLTKSEWNVVVKALNHARALHLFEHEVWRLHQQRDGWPDFDFSKREKVRDLNELLGRAVEFQQLLSRLDAKTEVKRAVECRTLDASRNKICSQIQRLAEEIVDAAVVMELSRAFSPDAQSALSKSTAEEVAPSLLVRIASNILTQHDSSFFRVTVQFSQIAGKAKFSRVSQASKMTQRQRRRRQEYLDSFNRCSRFIPCWVLTTSQISDYLPSECLFDLVIIDEASQSDVTVLPGMLRGKQWLIVGDGKQVSPTECFVSEDQINCLRAALPSSPLENSLLPGQSFFDMASQAFPRGRVSCRARLGRTPQRCVLILTT